MPEQTKIVAQNGVLAAEHWQGPLPPPATMEVYERLHPGTLERLLSNFEKESEERRAIDRAEIKERAEDRMEFDRRAVRGQWMAFALTLVAFTVAGISAWMHEPAIGVAAIGVTILGIVKALLGSRAKK